MGDGGAINGDGHGGDYTRVGMGYGTGYGMLPSSSFRVRLGLYQDLDATVECGADLGRQILELANTTGLEPVNLEDT